jgi:hypothetical protein
VNVAAYRPEKKNPHCIQFTCGGDKVIYDREVSTKTADMSTVKVILNDAIFLPDGKYMTMDLSNFYLETPMDNYEYTCIPIWVVPNAIIEEYNLASHLGRFLQDIENGMISNQKHNNSYSFKHNRNLPSLVVVMQARICILFIRASPSGAS